MKKLLAITIVIAQVASFAACGTPTATEEAASADTEQSAIEPKQTNKQEQLLESTIKECASEDVSFEINEKGIWIYITTEYDDICIQYDGLPETFEDVTLDQNNVSVYRNEEHNPEKVTIRIEKATILQNIPFDLVVSQYDDNGTLVDEFKLSKIFVSMADSKWDLDIDVDTYLLNDGKIAFIDAIRDVSDINKFEDIKHILLYGDGIYGDVSDLSNLKDWSDTIKVQS